MPAVHAIPLLISILIGLLLGLITWGFLRARGHEFDRAPIEVRDDVLIGLLVLAAFALGIFLTYALLGLNWWR